MHMLLFVYILVHSDWLERSYVLVLDAVVTAILSVAMAQRFVHSHIYFMFCQQLVNIILPTADGFYQSLTLNALVNLTMQTLVGTEPWIAWIGPFPVSGTTLTLATYASSTLSSSSRPMQTLLLATLALGSLTGGARSSAGSFYGKCGI